MLFGIFLPGPLKKPHIDGKGRGAHTEIDQNKLIVKLYHSKESQEQSIFDNHVL